MDCVYVCERVFVFDAACVALIIQTSVWHTKSLKQFAVFSTILAPDIVCVRTRCGLHQTGANLHPRRLPDCHFDILQESVKVLSL